MQYSPIFGVVSLIVLVFSIIVHELAHGYMANYLGDPTARLAGRLTLNPLKHIDPFGSIILPIITFFAGFTFGYAKPVPFNPYNLKNRRQGEFLIAAAGPLSNLALAFIFGTIIRYSVAWDITNASFLALASYIVLINISLAIFNLIPLPPLDGSKVLFNILPKKYDSYRPMLEMYGPIWIMIVVIFLWRLLLPIVPYIYHIFTGFYF